MHEIELPLPDSVEYTFTPEVEFLSNKLFVCSDLDTIAALYYSSAENDSLGFSKGDLYLMTCETNCMRFAGWLYFDGSLKEEVNQIVRSFERLE